MEIRLAVPDDALAIASVHVRSWQKAYRKLLPADYLDQLRPEDRAPHYDLSNTDPAKSCTIVAIEKNAIAGFATTGPSRETDLPGHGELRALYVDPEHWGRLVGASLISVARANFLHLGTVKAYLWLLKGNRRADRFYRKDLWSHDGRERTETVWGVALNELRYRRVL